MKTKSKVWAAAFCLGLFALAGGSRLSAAPADKALSAAELELKTKMRADGWKEIANGVYERQRGPNKVEHLGYGREGLVWTVGELNRQLDGLMAEYLRYPSEDLYKVIDHLSLKIADAKRDLRNTKSLAAVSEAISVSGCSACYGATSDAYPLSGSAAPGVGAIADANFNSTCGYSGDTYAYAYARATLNGTTTTHTVEDPHTGTSVTSHASATVNGTSNCSSMANSYAQSTALGISFTTSHSNTSCPAPAPPPPPAPTVTISGTPSVSVNGTGCVTLTWTSAATGTAPFSSAWTIDGVAAGTSSSVSRVFCGTNTTHSQTVNVALTVTDGTGQTATATFVTTIHYTATAPPTPPAVSITSTTPISISGTACQTVTWTAGVSGGTSPFSYAWTIDGAAAGTSTSTAVSHTYCGTNTTHTQTVNVSLSVADAASQTGSASYATTIYYSSTYIPPPGSGCLVAGDGDGTGVCN